MVSINLDLNAMKKEYFNKLCKESNMHKNILETIIMYTGLYTKIAEAVVLQFMNVSRYYFYQQNRSLPIEKDSLYVTTRFKKGVKVTDVWFNVTKRCNYTNNDYMHYVQCILHPCKPIRVIFFCSKCNVNAVKTKLITIDSKSGKRYYHINKVCIQCNPRLPYLTCYDMG